MFTRKHELRLESLEHRYLLSTTLDYSTYLAGRGVLDVTTDQDGYVYVLRAVGGGDTEVVKLDPDLQAPLSCPGQICWKVSLSDSPVGGAIAVHNNSVYVTGQRFGGPTGRDAFVAKLSKDNQTTPQIKPLAGDQSDAGTGIAVDAAGHIYVSGTTGSDGTFPAPDGPPPLGVNEGFVVKLDPNLVVTYSTLLTGSGDDFTTDLALTDCDVDGANCNVVVTGRTSSGDFAGLSSHNGQEDAFVVKVEPDGVGGVPDPDLDILSGTFLGGGSNDQASAVVIGPNDDVFVTGTTDSTDFLPIPNVGLAGNADAFLVRLNQNLDPNDLNEPPYSTLVGGSREDKSADVAVDAAGIAYLAGKTSSTDFPVMNPINDGDIPYSGAARSGKSDAFVARIDTNGAGLTDSTYLGGSKQESASSIVLTADNKAWVGGATDSSDFPTTPGALDSDHEGPGGQEAGNDPFLTRLDFPPPPPPSISIDDVSVTEGDSGTTEAVFTVTLSAAMSETVTVAYSTSDDSATAGSDYVATSGQLTISAGSLSGTITVFVNGDTTEENDEAFFLDLTSATTPSGVVPIADNQGVGTILDDDAPVGSVSVDYVDPVTASPGDQRSVTVSGSGFVDGATVDFGTRVTVQNVTFVDTSTLDVQIKVHPKAALGSRDVTVTNPDGSSGTCGGCFTVDGSLNVAGGADRGLTNPAPLNEATLQSVVQQASAIWQQTAVSADAAAALGGVEVRIADFDGTQLGAASPAGTVWIDRDAAGYGWSVGTPSPGQQGVDLLSVVTHELGHVLGLDHDVMGAVLPPGVRDLDYLDDLMSETGSWLELRQPGDANGDGHFDAFDLIAVLQADKYLTGQNADWSQGDWDGNGVFDQLDVIEALQSGRYAP